MHIIKSIHIEKFRAFHDLDIPTDKNVVAIAGQNGTQKTTLLGMLAQSVTISQRPFNGEHTIDGESFKTDMREKFKFSEQYDKIGEHAWSVTLDPAIDERGEFSLRSYPRNDDSSPFYLRFWNENNSRRKGTGLPQCPAVFLSMKRLIPLGEIEDLSDEEISLDDEESAIYRKYHNHILIMLDEIESIHKLSDKASKTSLGPQTKSSGPTTISAGQDNVGKVIQAILSFRRLKNKYPDDYVGGLVFIDEIESTLYPAAQIRLLKFMLKMAEELHLQFFFTTHSLTLLQYLTSEEAKKTSETALVYLKKLGSSIVAPSDPTWNGIVKDLTVNFTEKPLDDKIEVFAEDAVSFDFLDVLLPTRIARLLSRQKQCTLGFGQYEKLLKQQVHEFSSNVIVLDGDAFRGPNKLKKSVVDSYKNWVALPGVSYPEFDIYEYVWSLRDDEQFWPRNLEGYGSQDCFRNYTEHLTESAQIKSWYKSVPKKEMKRFLKAYFDERNAEVSAFQESFVSAYNSVAKQHGLQLIAL